MMKRFLVLATASVAIFCMPAAFAGKSPDDCNAEVTPPDATDRQHQVAKCLFDAAPATAPEPPKPKLKPFRSTAAGHKKAVAVSTQAVRDELKDPDSAKFKNLTSNRNFTVCGEVNGKNSYGGYIGFKRFVALGPVVFMEESTAGFDDTWEMSCSKNLPPK